MAIEKDVEDPQASPIFQKYTVVGTDHHVVEFITDYLRMMVSGNLNAHEIESLMDSEIETHHNEAHGPVSARSARLAGALPAFGIVAAVLGVVNTMGSVGQPPAILGGMIGSALVGTFLGILLAYGCGRAARRPARAEGRRRLEGAAVHQDDAAREHAGLRAAGRGRVRAQGAVLERPADVRRARRPRQGQEVTLSYQGRAGWFERDRAGRARPCAHVPGEDQVRPSPPPLLRYGQRPPSRSCTHAARGPARAPRLGRGRDRERLESVMAGDSKKLQPIIIKRVQQGRARHSTAAPGRSPMPTS